MGKQTETRFLDYTGWKSRDTSNMNIKVDTWGNIKKINSLIVSANELLKGHDEISPFEYTDQEETITTLAHDYECYVSYIDALYKDVYDIDHAFYVDIKNNAVEQLSKVLEEKYSVQDGDLADKYGDIKFSDFLPVALPDPERNSETIWDKLNVFATLKEMYSYVTQISELDDFRNVVDRLIRKMRKVREYQMVST